MAPALLYTLMLLALVSGPSAFLLLWLYHVRTRLEYVRDIACVMAGLFFIFLGNSAAMAFEDVFGVTDPRVYFLVMNEVFLATVFQSIFLCRFSHSCTGIPPRAGLVNLFWFVSILFFFLVQSGSLFANSLRIVDLGPGYLLSTLYGSLCQVYTTVFITVNRKHLPPTLVRVLPPFFAFLLGLGFLSVANDIVHFGSLLGGRDFPFSPFFFLIINVVTAVYSIRELLARGGTEREPPASPEPADFGLSEREAEILPLLLEGLSNEEIADRLFISSHTVKNHVTNIFRKTGVANRFELLKIVGRKG